MWNFVKCILFVAACLIALAIYDKHQKELHYNNGVKATQDSYSEMMRRR